MSNLRLFFISIFVTFISTQTILGQCNTNTTICTPGVAGPFTFAPGSANPGGCLAYINGANTPNYAYIILYITQSGTLDLLIDGNNTGPGAGCLDVQIFDITNATDPCASLNFGSAIACNYVNPCNGCAEFGFTINGCAAQVAGPTVNAGDILMILVEDYSDAQSSFTLELGNGPNSAQTGPPDATITNVGPFCDDDGPVQLDAVNMGGNWSGPGVSSTGVFNPATAGPGTHTINYSIGTAPCAANSSTTITVDDCSTCFMSFFSTNIGACNPTDNTFQITGTVEFSAPPTTGQLVVSDCNGNQAVFNPPFTSPLSYTIPGIDSDGTTNCSITAQFTADPACTITISPFNYPEACVCQAEIGSFTDGVVGDANSSNPWALCFGDELDIIGNGDFVASQDFNLTGVTYNPGVWLLVYDCPPTVGTPDDINTDPCLLGVASTADQAWTIINNTGSGNTLYFVPVTMYSMVDGIYAISLNGGEWCYDLGPTYPVTFLPQIVTSQVQDCQAGTATVTVNGGAPAVNGSQFTASNLVPGSASFGSTTASNGGTFTINGLQDGDAWSFDIIDNNGCPISVSGTFVGVEDPAFTYPTDTYCQDELNPSPTVTGDPGGTFTSAPAGLSINSTSGLINLAASTPGTYTVTYTTPDPICFDQATFEITINPVPVIDPIVDVTICFEYILPTITGTNLTGNQSYYTGPGGTGTPLTAGTVINTAGANTIYVYDATGTVPNCFDETSFVVTISLTPILDPVANITVCDAYTFGTITGTNLTGNQAYYTAPNGGGTQYNAGNIFTTAGLTTIYVYDATGTVPNCLDEVSFTINISITPTFTVTFTNPTECSANDGTITLSGLTPGQTYNVGYTANGTPIGPNSMTANAAGELVITGLTAGTYSNFVVELNGCIGTSNAPITLVDPNAPALSAGPDVQVCEGETITLTAVNPEGAIITWNNGVNDGVAFNQNVGTVTYTVTANLDNCISTDQVIVTVHPTPNVFAGNDVLACAGQSVILTGTGAQSYVWDNGVTNGVAFTPTTTQTYTVVGTSQFGCVASDEVTVTVEELPTLAFIGDNLEGCAPVTTTFTNLSAVAAGSQCVWYLSNGTVLTGCENVSYTFNNPGCYDVTLEVTSANGCSNSLTFEDYVCVQAYPLAYFTYSPNQPTTINSTVNFTNGSIGASSYEWFFGDGATSNAIDPNHTYADIEGDYIVTLVASTSFGCTDTARSIVNIVEELIFYVPNTFTPDGDDYNETFQPVFTSGFDPFDFHLMIFNRWGELIFESYDASIGWDGTYGGKATGADLVKDGTYVWKIEVKTKLNDERKMFVGHVNVLK
jgi:gliding motility-associated-like protein